MAPSVIRNRVWFCYVEDSGGPAKRHTTRVAAEIEAERLARKTGKAVHILETVAACALPGPVKVDWVRFDESAPTTPPAANPTWVPLVGDVVTYEKAGGNHFILVEPVDKNGIVRAWDIGAHMLTHLSIPYGSKHFDPYFVRRATDAEMHAAGIERKP